MNLQAEGRKPMADKFVLLLDFTSGIIEPLPLSSEALANDRIAIVIDELNECVWLWQGADTTLIERRAAQRKAQSLVSAGHQFGPLRIGRALSRVQVIDGQILDDPETKASYDRLLQTLRQKFTITEGVLGRFGAAAPAPSSRPAPSPPARAPSRTPSPEVPPPVAAKPQPKVVAAAEPAKVVPPVTTPREVDDLAIVRVGILIACILEYFPLCYVSSAKGLAGIRYRIEDPDGVICELDVDRSSVHFVKRYDFRGKRTEVLARLRQHLDSVSL
jgi:hypothetical protein